MADPIVTLTNGVPTSGSGVITTLGQLIDPTNGPAAIKAASTAPVAADKAIVVTMSPNSAGLITAGTPGTPNVAQVLSVQGVPSATPLYVAPYGDPANYVSGVTAAMTGTTQTLVIAAPATGLRNYITQITVSNSHATVGTDVEIRDGSTLMYVIPAAAVYGGAVLTFPTPLRQPTTATAINCANGTTGASTRVSASGYKGA
jgi:hypothetical protein